MREFLQVDHPLALDKSFGGTNADTQSVSGS